MFEISMLPAAYGDAIWIEYGDREDPHRILIDGGPEYAYPAIEKRIPLGGCHFELLVITHIDQDHIGGVLELLRRAPEGVTFGDIWFNGWKHLPSDELGAAQGEIVSALIGDRGLPWNKAFDGGAVALTDDGALPEIAPLAGDMKLTLLSPSLEELGKLRDKWEEELIEKQMDPSSAEDARAELERRYPEDVLGEEGPPDPERDVEDAFVSDRSAANGSSIVFLAEHDGKRALLCGDAYPSLVLRGIEELTEGGRLAIDALKISHHGSHKNTSADEISAVRCPRYLVSTNGSRYKHPDNAALTRVVLGGGDSPTLYFNYRSTKNEPWGQPALRSRYAYETVYPLDGEEGLTVAL